MLSFCALILSGICIPQDLVPVTTFSEAIVTSPDIEARKARGRAAQERSGLVIDLFSSDMIVGVAQPNPEINRTCNTQTCIYYRRHCTSDHECKYVFTLQTRQASDANQDLYFNSYLTLAAPNAAALAKLASRMTFKSAKDETAGPPGAQAIAVSDLEQESPDAKVPIPRRVLPTK